MQRNDAFVNEDGIKIYYNNLILKLNYGYAYITLNKNNGKEVENEKLSKPTKEKWQELVREIKLPVIEFKEDYMIISWNAVEEWKEEYVSSIFTGYLKVKLRNLKYPIQIEVGRHEMKEYFLKVIPERRADGADSFCKIYVKRRIIPLAVILGIGYIMYLFKL